jgi:glycosyltransferase involved in cell wall biosynthesis
MKKLKSLTIFFPFFNDEGTVKKAIKDAYFYGKKVANKLEVIAIHGGRSKDNTLNEIKKQKNKHLDLIIINKIKNKEGYAVIKHGFKRALGEWIFYTDGDLQYNLKDIIRLVKTQEKTGADVINGYKVKRADNILRDFLGYPYQVLSRHVFKLPIRDLTCDFRLIRNKLIKKIFLKAKDASILTELILKLKSTDAKFAEIPVLHKKRSYGESNYNLFTLFQERVLGDLKTFFLIRKKLYNKSHENH